VAAPSSADKPARSAPLESDVAAMAFIQSASLCKDLEPELLNELYKAGIVVEYGPASIVLTEGDGDQDLFFIVEGSVSVCKQGEGTIIELATLERPVVFGEKAVLTQQPRSASVITQTEVRLVRFPGELVRKIADKAPKFGRMLAMLMAARAKDTTSKVR
jgi:CRP-like cAMP-binding protein